MSPSINVVLTTGEFLINAVYISTTSKWIRTPTASNGNNSTSIRMSSTPSHYGSNPPALHSVATYLQRSRLPMKTRLPNMVSRNPHTKVYCSRCPPSSHSQTHSSSSSHPISTTAKRLATLSQLLQHRLGRGRTLSRMPSGKLPQTMQLPPRPQRRRPPSLLGKRRQADIIY